MMCMKLQILVMDAGQCVEFDQPYLLLQNQKGYLSELVRKTGTGTAAFLTKIAKQVRQIFIIDLLTVKLNYEISFKTS